MERERHHLRKPDQHPALHSQGALTVSLVANAQLCVHLHRAQTLDDLGISYERPGQPVSITNRHPALHPEQGAGPASAEEMADLHVHKAHML